MVSIKIFEKTCSGAKNSRMGALIGNFKNVFENLGLVFYSTEMFLESGLVQMELGLEKNEFVVLLKRHW
jgi:hypothetical protein